MPTPKPSPRRKATRSGVATPLQDIVAFFQAQTKAVLTLTGFSGAGYEHPDRLRKQVTRILDREDPRRTLINIGVTREGIGRAYAWAKRRGFTTTGIVSTASQRSGTAASPHCDHPFYVEDNAWGGCVDGRLTPTSEAMVTVSDRMIAFGGGSITGDELAAMQDRGKPIRFRPAEMNHARAAAKAAARNLPPPTIEQLRGAAHQRFGHS